MSDLEDDIGDISDLSDSEKKEDKGDSDSEADTRAPAAAPDNKRVSSASAHRTTVPPVASTSNATRNAQPAASPNEEENDPRCRIYSDTIVIPKGLPVILGMLVREIIVHSPKPEDRLEFIRDFFEQLRDARDADPNMDLDRFLSTQSRIMQARIRNNISAEFSEPPDIRPILHAYTKELIRYESEDMFKFGFEYFEASCKGKLDAFLDALVVEKEAKYKAKWGD